MTTLVGTQSNFVEAMKELIELDYDASEAYKAAINRLENDAYKTMLKEFMEDHKRHIKELSELLHQHHEEPPTGPSLVKNLITQGKVVIANIAGDEAIISAMLSNEMDTNTAYERMIHRTDLWEKAKDVLKRGLEDERKHKDWLESVNQQS